MSGPPPASVLVARVKTESARDEAKVTGSLQAVARSAVAAREAGAVQALRFEEGQPVRSGDPLAELDPRRTEALLAEARARLTSAENLITQRDAERNRAATDLEMKAGLVAQRAVSRSEILDAESALAVADAQLAAARNAVAEARSRVDFLTVQQADLMVRAPFDGVVAERRVELGEWVNPGQVVAVVVASDPVEAWLRVPERHLADVAAQPSDVRVRISSTGEVLAPVAVRIVPDVDTRSQLFTVIATLANPERRLAPGQSVTGTVPAGTPAPMRVVPVDALLRTRSGDFVFVPEPGPGPMPAAKRLRVQVAFEREGSAYLVPVPGLEDGGAVVVEGNDRLLPGQPLLVQDAAPPRPQDPPRP
jgi:RND family efflux transporter MFP subunit